MAVRLTVKRDKQLADMKVQSHKKLTELTKRLKVENDDLRKQNLQITEQFNCLKRLMIAHEYDQVYREQESNVSIVVS